MGLKGNLIGIASIPTLALLIIGITSFLELRHAHMATQDLVENNFIPVVDKDAKRLVYELGTASSLILEADRDVHQALLAEKAALTARTDEERDTCKQANEENIGQARERIKKASAFFSEEMQKNYQETFIPAYDKWEEATQKVIELAGSSGKAVFARRMSNGGTAEESFHAMRDLLDQMGTDIYNETDAGIKAMEASRDHAVSQANDAATRAKKALLVLQIAVFGGFLLTIVITTILSRRLSHALRTLIANLEAAAKQVGDAAGQLAGTSQQMATGANSQASSLEETSSSLEEMHSMTMRNAESAQEANQASRAAQLATTSGKDRIIEMESAIGRIKSSADETAKIVKTIDEIAFQTNLLALNAAVEAARAGDAGRGFAVVAEEVRNLAQRSAEAAKNTADLITESIQNAESGVVASESMREAFDSIGGEVEKVTLQVENVAAASEEQTKGIDQINAGVSQINQITQSAAASAEESASTSEELAAQSEELKRLVGSLVNLVDGTGKRIPTKKTKRQAPEAKQAQKPLAQKPVAERGKKPQTLAKKKAEPEPAHRMPSPEAIIPFDEDDDF